MDNRDAHIRNEISKPKFILLDVYGTILDMIEVQKHVNAVLKTKWGYTLWFELFMQYSFVDNCTVQFHDFPSIAEATLKMTSQMVRQKIDESDVSSMLKLLEQLPIKEGVQRGLSQLNDQGIRVVALTNAPERIVRSRMERTGLVSYFEKILSAEHVGKYKPAVEVYRWAADEANVMPREILLVSAHGWDVAGAANAGMQTAYLQQEFQMLYPLAPRPNFVCKNLMDLSDQLNSESRIS